MKLFTNQSHTIILTNRVISIAMNPGLLRSFMFSWSGQKRRTPLHYRVFLEIALLAVVSALF